MHPFESNSDSPITEAAVDIEGVASNSLHDLIPQGGRSDDSRIRELANHVNTLKYQMKRLQVDMIIACQKIASLQKSNHLLQRETRSLRYDLYLARANRPAEGIQFMKFPTEIRLMIWYLAAGSDMQSSLEIIQSDNKRERFLLNSPFGENLSAPPLDTSFLVRCYSPRRIVAQTCREAQHILQPIQQACGFPTPMWSCMNGEQDSLILPHTFKMPPSMHFRDFLGLAKHVIVVPDPLQPHYALLESGSESIVSQLLKAVLNHEIELQRMSFVMTEIRVSTPVQAQLESDFKSYLPLSIDPDDQHTIDRVDEILQEFAPNTLAMNNIRKFDEICVRVRSWGSPTNIPKPWDEFKQDRIEMALYACGWDERIIAGLLGNTRGRRTKIASRYTEAYKRLPELRKVIMIYGSYEGPESAPIVGPDPLESSGAGEGRGRGMFGHVPRVTVRHSAESCPRGHHHGR
ncbi:hypothetical protein ANO14919_030010 [Xylariales sp. No.14919]|nr:hypothetical protein ANO14919_030010 [Xylariales sp. No.14919]